jgi:hypothetical protein
MAAVLPMQPISNPAADRIMKRIVGAQSRR